MVPDGSLFAFGLRRGLRGFALKFNNRESYVQHGAKAQNLDLRLSLLLSVSSDELSVEELSDVELSIDELSVDELTGLCENSL